jgi:methionine biosynthesis protein MetW
MSYEEYWSDDHSAGNAQDSRVAAFLSIVEPGSSVMEIGCGDGTLLSILRDRSRAGVKGYDISANAVQKARAKGVAAEVRNVSTESFREDECADYIIIADCMEHLPVPEDLLDRLRGRFRKALVISIPNSCYWRYRFRVLFGSFMVQWVAHPGEHLRFWSMSDMRWWLKELGFRVRSRYPTWGIPVLKHLWPSMFAQNVVWVITEATTPKQGERTEAARESVHAS